MCHGRIEMWRQKHAQVNSARKPQQRRFRTWSGTVPIPVTGQRRELTPAQRQSQTTGSRSPRFAYEFTHIVFFHDDSFMFSWNPVPNRYFLIVKPHRARNRAPQTRVNLSYPSLLQYPPNICGPDPSSGDDLDSISRDRNKTRNTLRAFNRTRLSARRKHPVHTARNQLF